MLGRREHFALVGLRGSYARAMQQADAPGASQLDRIEAKLSISHQVQTLFVVRWQLEP